MIARDDIKIVHVEASSRCNSHCPMCSRYDALGYTQQELSEENLSLEIFYKLFTKEFSPQLEHVYFSGVYGDPCINPHLPTMTSWLLDNGCKNISIDTNGGYRNRDYWKSLARDGVMINFSIDGADDESLQKYRIGVSYDKVIENLTAFVDAGGAAQWNFIVFKHNEHQVEQAREIATSIGAKFRIKVTQKFKKNKIFKVMKQGQHLHDLEPPVNQMYRHPNIGDEEHQPVRFSGLKLDNYRSFPIKSISCKSKARREIFLSSTGLVFPCCYLGTYTHDSPGSHQFNQLYNIDSFSLESNELDDILFQFASIESRWSNSIVDGNLITCYNTCSVDNKNTLYYSESLNKQEIVNR